MTGMFTDNQPDFSWLQPNEGKTFEQYFMPYAQTGVVKNATKEAMLNMEWEGQQLHIKIYATALYKDASVRILQDGKEVKTFAAALSPYAPFQLLTTVAHQWYQNNGRSSLQIKTDVNWYPGNQRNQLRMKYHRLHPQQNCQRY
ncbi:hypothetical protein [Chitinophaga pinensis]|uniref:hypothetical protein n=1 Tax=Chitinophaga pinensis TaxID=79329 RepID=UPI0039657A06